MSNGHGLRDAVAWLAELFGLPSKLRDVGCLPGKLWSARSLEVGLVAFDLGDVRAARRFEVRRPWVVCRVVARSSVLAHVDGVFAGVLSNSS